mmetsp:Transcript_47065/g.135598  ORF Transcript_47065/g.135598 Transcript_47065/m.135598 type:complete len:137 (-) Transcript_47065:487-897(-)
MIYTPPSFSDHTAISLLLDDDILKDQHSAMGLDEKDPPTKKAQPHKSQKSIASFFTASSTSSSTSSALSTGAARLQEKKRKNSIQTFLAQKTGDKKEVQANSSKRSKPASAPGAAVVARRVVAKKGSILAHFRKKT